MRLFFKLRLYRYLELTLDIKVFILSFLDLKHKVFILLRCIVAFFSISVFNCGFCYCVEIVGGRAATIVGIGLEIPWSGFVFLRDSSAFKQIEYVLF